MDDVDTLKCLDLGEVQAERLKRSLEFGFSSLAYIAPWLCAADMEVCFIGMLSAPAMDFDLNLFRELTAQIIDVDSSSTVNFRRIFTCKQANAH
jgi:hypothetical protein